MIAYLFKAPGNKTYPYELTICDKPCNGAEFQNSEKLRVAGKRDARNWCKDNNVTPYNF